MRINEILDIFVNQHTTEFPRYREGQTSNVLKNNIVYGYN